MIVGLANRQRAGDEKFGGQDVVWGGVDVYKIT